MTSVIYGFLFQAVCLLVLFAKLDAIPAGSAVFPGSIGNLTLTPTNGFGTFVTGAFSNLTCNNPLGNVLPGNPFVGNSSVPCRVAMTIHNAVSNTRRSRQLPGFDWDQIFGSGPTTAPQGGGGGGNGCNNVGSLFNPTNSPLNPLGFLGNIEVFNGTGRLVGGPYNFTLDGPVPNPFSVLNLPVVIWREALNTSLNLASQLNPIRMFACAFIRLTDL